MWKPEKNNIIVAYFFKEIKRKNQNNIMVHRTRNFSSQEKTQKTVMKINREVERLILLGFFEAYQVYIMVRLSARECCQILKEA